LFDAILTDDDAFRATVVVNELLAHGFRGSLTGGLAIEAHLCARGQHPRRRPLNDVDFVVGSFASIPESVADRFLLHHVHPLAPEGKTLMQLIDPARAVRVDVFRAFGATLSRSGPLGGVTGSLDVVALEDLMARTTAHVYGRLRFGRAIDAKHVRTFLELSGLDSEPVLEEAWLDHREGLSESFGEVSSDSLRLLALHPELVTTEEHSPVVTPCERCQDHGRFRCAPPERIVEILGYW
jgi:hypothetical protein